MAFFQKEKKRNRAQILFKTAEIQTQILKNIKWKTTSNVKYQIEFELKTFVFSLKKSFFVEAKSNLKFLLIADRNVKNMMLLILIQNKKTVLWILQIASFNDRFNYVFKASAFYNRISDIVANMRIHQK